MYEPTSSYGISAFSSAAAQKAENLVFLSKMKLTGIVMRAGRPKNRLPYIQYECTQGLINPDSGYDIQYQYNKATT